MTISELYPNATVSRHGFEGFIGDNELEVTREHDNDAWYIIVRGSDGCFCYDGWWDDSEGNCLADAMIEAFRGSCLTPPHELVALEGFYD